MNVSTQTSPSFSVGTQTDIEVSPFSVSTLPKSPKSSSNQPRPRTLFKPIVLSSPDFTSISEPYSSTGYVAKKVSIDQLVKLDHLVETKV